MVQGCKWRLTYILSYEDKLCNPESSWKFSWRQMLDVMWQSSRETSYHFPYLVDELRIWKLRELLQIQRNLYPPMEQNGVQVEPEADVKPSLSH